MLTVEPLSLDSAQEELRSVGVGTSVGHRQDTRASMLEGEVLVGEFLTVDGLTTSTVSASEVTTLAHELRDHTMERGTLEVERAAGFAHSLLAGAQGTKVLGSPGNDVGLELHDNATSGGTANGHVEENFRVRHFEGK